MMWRIDFLPKGYGITANDFHVLSLPHIPAWDEYGLGKGERPPLIEKIVKVIEEHMTLEEAQKYNTYLYDLEHMREDLKVIMNA